MSGSLSLERGLSVLEVLKDSDEPVGVREIARRLELSAPAIQRLLNTLADHGYVEQAADTRRYRIGHGVLALAQHVLRKDRLIGLAEPELQALAAEGCFNAFLGVRRGSAGLYLLAVQSRSPVVIRSSPGERMALHSTALGKALLLGLSDEAIGEILGEAPLERLTPRTVTEPGRLISQLRTAHTVGYTTSLDENILGVISVGAPVRGSSGSVVAAISVAYPRSVGPQIEIAEVGEKVMAAAARISAELGFASESEPEGRDPRHAA
ncbi:IclR family transcriptional regulator [Chelativorans intermedius]|jgi:DNA-binding IclR family transcriptional regulator|uniref:IclR family transcriptional regulator n=1 Tax=Chelativorans intermedius TaxID=515947 RepID=A0ABV6DAV3_9HYPH|nr:IclR family transcriptional regulator [Chelativorans intermedius]MCT9000172.1 IclR family transcriptional regulator [Chelativorans intermedius]